MNSQGDGSLSANAIRATVSGDGTAIDAIYSLPQRELRDAAFAMEGELLLTRTAVRRILLELKDQTISPKQARLWSDFVSYGSNNTEGTHAIDVAFESDYEDVLSEVLFSLREIDDSATDDLFGFNVDSLIQLVS